MASLQPSPRRVPSHVNDNQCVEFVTGQKDCVHVSGQIGLNPPPMIAGDKRETLYSYVDFCVANAHSVIRLPQEKGVISFCCQNYTEIKYVKDVSCVGHLSSIKSCHKCPNCCYRSTCRGKATPVLGEVGNPGFESKSSNHTQRGLQTPLPV